MFKSSAGSVLVFVSVLVLGGCGEGSTKVYPYSAQQAMQMLGGGNLPRVVGIKGGAQQIPEGGLRWNGRNGRKCEAAIKAVGDNQVEITPSCSAGSQEPASELTEQDRALSEFAFTEYVEATMQGRPLNNDMINARAAATAIKGIGTLGEELERQAAESAARDAENKRDREARKAAASFGQPTGMGSGFFGQPMTTPGN